MSALGSPSPLFLASAAADAAAGPIKSVRFNSDDSAYVNRTNSSAGSLTTWTWAAWVKLSKMNNTYPCLFGGGDANTRFFVRYESGGTWEIFSDPPNAGATERHSTNAVFRDFSGWAHYVLVWNTTSSVADERVRFYVNGVEQTLDGTFSQNLQSSVNNNSEQLIGKEPGYDRYLDGYLADVYFIDGQALDPTSFGAFDSSGVWQAAAYSGTYGTNGFHLFDFANESTVGHDSSGNNNDFTANNISTSNGTIASPTRFDWETTDTGWSLSDSDYTATNTTSGYRQVYSEALGSSTTYHFVLSEKPGDNNGGWFMSSNTSVNDTHPDELSGDVVGQRTGESGLGLNGSFATANGVSSGQNAITGFSDITATSQQFNHSEWVINMTARKVWVRSFGSSSWIKGGDPTNSSSTPSFSLPTGTIHFGYVGYSSNETQVKFVTSVASVALGNDISFDVPTNGDQSDTGAGGEVSGNYCVWNSLVNKTYTLSNGNLDLDFVSGSGNLTHGTIAVSSGKWYWEVTHNSGNAPMIGIVDSTATIPGMVYSQNTALYYHINGYLYGGMGRGNDASYSTYGASYTNGDIIGVALDLDNGNINFYKNGVDQGVANQRGGTTYSIAGTSIFPAGGNGGGSANTTANFGQRAFAYSAPSGYKALCTTNLPTPTIADGSDYFDTKLWTGNGSTQTISGLEFSPDLVWIKSRSGAFNHLLFDQIRGTTKYLSSNTTSAEGTDNNSLTAFTSDGFSVGYTNAVNQSSGTLVAWAWDAGANSSKTYTVKVVSDSGNKYRFDDFGTSAVTLDLEEGSTYVFDQSDSSNSGHPLRFSTTSDGTHGGGSEYTTGVTTTGTPGSAGAKTTIVVGSSVATLYYYCSAHSGMGGQANTNSTAGASNFDGTIQSTVRANQTAGFSIVSWTGTGSNASIGHGLNSEPYLVIIRNRSSVADWVVYHNSVGATKALHLQTTSAGTAASTFFQNTAPTSSVFSTGTNNGVALSGSNFIAYCFAPVAGYSAFGSYEGNGDANGTVVYTGFKPAFLMLKRTDGSAAWYMYDYKRDGYNAANKLLYANYTNVEANNSIPDLLSNGFKVRTTGTATNGSGNDYIYMAFAENPFQANGGLAR